MDSRSQVETHGTYVITTELSEEQRSPRSPTTPQEPSLKLKLTQSKDEKNKNDRKVKFHEDTVDNEHLNKKKSKCCCIYEKPKTFDDTSSDDENVGRNITIKLQKLPDEKNKMTSEMNVPCILVDNENFSKWWPSITKCLSQSDFIAIDLELSGIGPKEIFSSQVDERYNVIREVASTRSILSMGLACFKINTNKGFFKSCQKSSITEQQEFVFKQISDCLDADNTEVPNNAVDSSDDRKQHNFYSTVNVFNFLTLNTNSFVIETRSMKFLAQQGFDFNELSLKGIPFCPGNDPSDSSTETSIPSLRRLMNLLISLKLPILFHNGLIDLAFLYHNFYAEIPSKLDTFVADLYEMFPNGIFDTKYIAIASLSSSYLEYLFQYSQRHNYFRRLKNLPCLELEFTKYEDEEQSCDIRVFDLSPKIMQLSLDVGKICENYAKYGWCEKSDMCEYSHNIDLILDEELKSKKDKNSKMLINRLKQIKQTEQPMEVSSFHNENNGCDDHEKPHQGPTPLRKSGCHHAGNDAFMTGYFFLFHQIINSKSNCTVSEFRKFSNLRSKFKNKIFLSCKPRPLNIMKSAYATNSTAHKKKLNIIKEKSDWT